MAKKKVDIIALSKSKGYKIAMFSALGLGIVCMAVGFIMQMGVTPTVLPKALRVQLSGIRPLTAYSYEMKISQDEYILVDTDTGDNALAVPIVFTLKDGGENILEPLPNMYRTGLAHLKLKTPLVTGASGILEITCGSQPKIIITITTYSAL